MNRRENQIDIKLMNEYGADMPLWGDDGHTDGEELALSDRLRSDLALFARRWEQTIPAKVYDDRWDGNPIMSRLQTVRYALPHLLRAAKRRAEETEDAEMRRIGEELRGRLQDELGSRYSVTFHP